MGAAGHTDGGISKHEGAAVLTRSLDLDGTVSYSTHNILKHLKSITGQQDYIAAFIIHIIIVNTGYICLVPVNAKTLL